VSGPNNEQSVLSQNIPSQTSPFHQVILPFLVACREKFGEKATKGKGQPPPACLTKLNVINVIKFTCRPTYVRRPYRRKSHPRHSSRNSLAVSDHIIDDHSGATLTNLGINSQDKNFKHTGLGALQLGNSDGADVGDFVVALGAPFGLEASVSFGVISALGRGSLSIAELGNFIQTDAAINPGNSGGPLVSTSGQAIGINTAIFSKSGAYNGIGFAIPANLVRGVAEQIITEGKVERGYLGVGLNQVLDPELSKELGLPDGVTGALVSSVEPGGPAEKGGLEAGDVVTAIDSKKVNDELDLRSRIGLMKPHTKVNLTVVRGGKERALSVTLGNYPSELLAAGGRQRQGQPYGLGLAQLSAQLQSKFGIKSKSGAAVIDVEENSSAARAGLQPGDVILQANNKKIGSPQGR
jgi:S1-C subfamily serine protease